MRGVALNFFALEQQDLRFTVFTHPQERFATAPPGGRQSRLPEAGSNGEYVPYWTYWEEREGTHRRGCDAFTNIYLTLDRLRHELIQKCRQVLDDGQFRVKEGFRKQVYIVLDGFPQGDQAIWLEPYLLRSQGQFGFLADFRFLTKPEHRGSIRALQLSLSLDEAGQSNSDFYADRYDKLLEFVERFHSTLFPLDIENTSIPVSRRLSELEPTMLDVKTYVVGDGREARSQFMGVKDRGPLGPAPSPVHLHFLYRPEDKPLSYDLFRALRGDTFRTFPGMEQMFGVPLTSESVSGTPLRSFSPAEIEEASELVASRAEDRRVVAVVITPFSKDDDPEENEAYWYLKHRFLTHKIPIQVVAAGTIRETRKLKWSISGIGLQIFAKAGGTPWKVRPRHERCLIVGLGQAHRRREDQIERYFAYSILTDSSGVFEEVRILGDSPNEAEYLVELGANVQGIIQDYADDFDTFVIHATFSVRKKELRSLDRVLQDLEDDGGGGRTFVSMKFNDRNKYFGYAIGHNSRVPHESTTIQLSGSEHLVWFEGLQSGKPTLRDKVGGPVHVSFNYPKRGFGIAQQVGFLQDAINLSGANWRGFNARSLPVSVYYAQLIARYTKEFDARGFAEVDLTTLTPWFL